MMLLLHWEVYVLMVVTVNFLNKDLHWFCRKRALIDGGVYMCFNGGVDSKVASSFPMWFCI